MKTPDLPPDMEFVRIARREAVRICRTACTKYEPEDYLKFAEDMQIHANTSYSRLFRNIWDGTRESKLAVWRYAFAAAALDWWEKNREEWSITEAKLKALQEITDAS